MTGPEVGSIAHPAFTWNLLVTVVGGGILMLMIKRWFEVMNQKAEERYKEYMAEVNKKVDLAVCQKEHQLVGLMHESNKRVIEDLACDIKEVKKGISNILQHLTGIPHA